MNQRLTGRPLKLIWDDGLDYFCTDATLLVSAEPQEHTMHSGVRKKKEKKKVVCVFSHR